MTIKKYVALWGIAIDHFDPDAVRNEKLAANGRRSYDLHEVMVENSTYCRWNLKERLFREGLKQRQCEDCGQDETWRGKRMALILDHINGVPDDHRLENLRVLCPNCAATLPTHCGAKNRLPRTPINCEMCGAEFLKRRRTQRFCSRSCAERMLGLRAKERYRSRPQTRKVERPPYEQLMAEIEATNYSAVGRKYGVSDNAIRKWVRWYEREAELKRRAA